MFRQPCGGGGHLQEVQEAIVRGLVTGALTLGLAFALASPAVAQHRPRDSGQPVSVISLPPGTRIVSATRPFSAPARGTTTDFRDVPAGVLGTASVESLLQTAPGLGFDFTHQAALDRNLDVRALIDPVTQHRLALARQIRRETPRVGFGVPFVFTPIQIVIIQQPPILLMQQAPVEYEARADLVRASEAAARREPPSELAPSAVEPPPPLPPLGELILIRTDGRLLFAVAVSFGRERVIYISPEGIRRTVALAEIDLDATLRFNEERGSRLSLPN